MREFSSRSEKKRTCGSPSTPARYTTERRDQARLPDDKAAQAPRPAASRRDKKSGVLRDLTDREREEYFRGVQPIWGGGLNPDRFVAFQRRLADSREAGRQYRLFGLFDGDRLLSAMKAYDLRGAYAGEALRIFGIGAVYTPPALRRRGHARRMLELALADHRSRGYAAAVLFSDIGGAYYERLGFRALESEECTAGADDLPRGG